jgi:hypothetical protein
MCEKTKCADCEAVVDCDDHMNCDGDVICVDCADDYVWDELTDMVIRADDSVQAEHYGYDRNRYGSLYTITTHDDNTEYVDGEHYTEDAVNHLFCDCISCNDRISQEESYHTDYDGPYCCSCIPSSSNHYSGGDDVDETTYNEMTSSRTFGLELEYADSSDCAERNENNGRHYFESKEDGSIRGDCPAEFVSPILKGDAGLDAIREFADCAEHADPDKSCGFHLHVGIDDLSDYDKSRLIRFFAKIEKVARMFVPSDRSENLYCNGRLDCAGADDSVPLNELRNKQRYSAFNFASYNPTVEIRFHHSTICVDEMVNWVKLWVAAVDYIAGGGDIKGFDNCSDQRIFNRLTGLAGRDVAEFYAERAERYGYSDSIKKEAISFNNDCAGQLFLQFA